jgi:hypothetical protein
LFLVRRRKDGHLVSVNVTGQAPDFHPFMDAVKNEMSTFVLTMSAGTDIVLGPSISIPEQTVSFGDRRNRGEGPKENAREEADHGETAKCVGHDAYPSLFIDFDTMDVASWWG